MMDAWIRYSKPPEAFEREQDNDLAEKELDKELMTKLGYKLPAAAVSGSAEEAP